MSTIKTAATTSLEKLKGKLRSLFSSEKTSDNPEQKSASPEYQKLKDYLKKEQLEINRPVIEEARRKRDEILETRHMLPMSKWDFDTYFASEQFDVSYHLNQQNVGDCYMVAAIHAMSRSPHFEIICRSSMKRGRDGIWKIRIPLLSEDGKIITITPEELSSQKNKQFLRSKFERKLMPDLRYELEPLKGKEGLQALEAACIKARFGKVDRLAAEGGLSIEVLKQLGGDNFKQYFLLGKQFNEGKNQWEPSTLRSLNDRDTAYLDHFLENFDPEIQSQRQVLNRIQVHLK